MYIAVCDDQAEELEQLIELLDLWQRERRTALRFRSFRSAAELLDAAEKEPFTLYLLDVMMPGMDGLAAAREIRCCNDAADIVFLTSSPGFAYESYSVRALDYLLKPIRAGMLFPILDRLSARTKAPRRADTEMRVFTDPGPLFPARLCGGQWQTPLFQPDGRIGARSLRYPEGVRTAAA